MAIKKYNFLDSRSLILNSSLSNDISLALETSVVLSGPKYPTPKTRITFNFLKTAILNVVKQFFITVSHAKPNGIYYGFDASERCVILSPIQLDVGKRYSIYGRLRRRKILYLECIKIQNMNYKNLCYEIF